LRVALDPGKVHAVLNHRNDESADQRPERFAVGEKVDARITLFDRRARKVSVSIKALEVAEEKEAIAQYGSADSGASLGDIANVEHFIPRDWISEDGYLPNEKFIEYARPLIEGEVKPPVESGLPKYVVLEKSKVEKKLPPREA